MSKKQNYRLDLPRLVGSRERVQGIIRHMPSNLNGNIVTVDALQTVAMAQCAVDELCKQIAEIRNADIILLATSDTLIERAKTSAKTRGFENRLSIQSPE